MKNTKKVIKVIITLLRIALLCYIAFYMWLFYAITPYQDWDLSLKLIDYDKLDAFKILYPIGFLINGVIAFLSKKSKFFCISHLILALLCIIYSVWLFTLS